MPTNSTFKDIVNLRLENICLELKSISNIIGSYNGFGNSEAAALIDTINEARAALVLVTNYIVGEYEQLEFFNTEENNNES